ncbi:uncharacterized protein LOC110870763 isoform X1 [Helianthus annuus]|uniref:uncharacterized protein LOC110870763 isoform X1 n=1 Tax=Helianthus annuus TaxID=4232 RepID=UPI000B909DDC|nr:uncharacterized protein LOC110870763 isoform X1 [Helianthus annuus]
MTTTKPLPKGMQLCSSPPGEANSPSLNALLTMIPILSVTDQDSLPITFDQLLNEPDLSTFVEPVYGLYQKEIEVRRKMIADSKKQQDEKDGVETQDHVLENPNESSKGVDQNDMKEARNEVVENLDEKSTVSEHDSVEFNDMQQDRNNEGVKNPNDMKEPSNEDVSVDKNDMDQDIKVEGVENPNDHMQELRNEDDPPQNVEDPQQDVVNPVEDPQQVVVNPVEDPQQAVENPVAHPQQDVANPAEDQQQVRNQEPQDLNLDLNNERLWPSLGVAVPMIRAQRIRPGRRM